MKINALAHDLIRSSDAQTVIETYATRLERCIRSSPEKWSTILTMSPKECKDLKKGTIARVLYDLSTAEIEREFQSDAPHVYTIRSYGSLRINFEDQLIARINKCDAEGRPRRNHTLVTRAFYGQQYKQLSYFDEQIKQLGLPGINQPTLINIGYRLDPTLTQLRDILVACPLGTSILWSFSILGPNQIEVIPLASVQEPARKAKVVPKQGAIRDAEQREN